jgi:Arc/MetJ family transcription regulator
MVAQVHAAGMAMTIELDDDTAAAVRALRYQGMSVSEAVNQLIRRGMLLERPSTQFEPRTRPLGLTVDVASVAEALEVLEGPTAR